MPEEITKDEIKAIIETQSKATEQMVIVAGHLKTIADEQKKISAMMSNGLKKEIVDSIVNSVNENFKEAGKVFQSCNVKMDTVKNDVQHAKWFIAIVGVLIVVLTIMFRFWGFTDTRINEGKLLKHWEALHEHTEQLHGIKQ